MRLRDSLLSSRNAEVSAVSSSVLRLALVPLSPTRLAVHRVPPNRHNRDDSCATNPIPRVCTFAARLVVCLFSQITSTAMTACKWSVLRVRASARSLRSSSSSSSRPSGRPTRRYQSPCRYGRRRFSNGDDLRVTSSSSSKPDRRSAASLSAVAAQCSASSSLVVSAALSAQSAIIMSAAAPVCSLTDGASGGGPLMAGRP